MEEVSEPTTKVNIPQILGVTKDKGSPGSNSLLTEQNSANKPIILEALNQYTREKEVVLHNKDSWSALNDTDDEAKPNLVSLDSPQSPLSPGENPLWSEFKNRQAQNILREKERIEAESAKHQHLKAIEAAELLRIEEKRKQDFEQTLKETEEKTKQLQNLREAERRKRARDTPSVDLRSQTEIMASLQKNFVYSPFSPEAMGFPRFSQG
jgi:hypothetical protein